MKIFGLTPMKLIKLSSIILCLLLIGLLPQSVRHSDHQTPPTFISGAVSTNVGFSQTDESIATHLNSVVLTEGKSLFERHCGRCHSTGFVMGSGINSIMADSLVVVMVDKAGFQFDPAQHLLITRYLHHILPQ